MCNTRSDEHMTISRGMNHMVWTKSESNVVRDPSPRTRISPTLWLGTPSYLFSLHKGASYRRLGSFWWPRPHTDHAFRPLHPLHSKETIKEVTKSNGLKQSKLQLARGPSPHPYHFLIEFGWLGKSILEKTDVGGHVPPPPVFQWPCH